MVNNEAGPVLHTMAYPKRMRAAGGAKNERPTRMASAEEALGGRCGVPALSAASYQRPVWRTHKYPAPHTHD